jgi:hypothetical protein
MSRRDYPRIWRLVRDAVLFVAGLVGIIQQTVIAESPNPTLLLIFAAMVGLPGFLRRDEIANGK